MPLSYSAILFLCNLYQGHPHAAGELRRRARKPEGVGPGQDEGHGHWGEQSEWQIKSVLRNVLIFPYFAVLYWHYWCSIFLFQEMLFMGESTMYNMREETSRSSGHCLDCSIFHNPPPPPILSLPVNFSGQLIWAPELQNMLSGGLDCPHRVSLKICCCQMAA